MKKSLNASKMQALQAKLSTRKLKNSCASRKTNYKKNAIKAGMSYADYVKEKCGVDLVTFEDYTWSLPARASGGTTPEKGTPEWKEYKSVASRKTYMKTVVECAACVDDKVTDLESFVKHHTSADTVEEFLSTEYCHANKSAYSVRGYEFLSEFH